RRTALQVYRGNASWHLNPGVSRSKLGELIIPPNSFDILAIECGRTSTGERISAATAQNLSGERNLRYRPAERLFLSGRKPFSFSLQKAVYARTMHGGIRREAVLGLDRK